jgi:DnaJ-class molecular chaperone
VSPLSTFDEISRKYKKIVKESHPDVAQNSENILKINEAYEILKDYIKNYKFTFSEEEISRQYPAEFLKKFKVENEGV